MPIDPSLLYLFLFYYQVAIFVPQWYHQVILLTLEHFLILIPFNGLIEPIPIVVLVCEPVKLIQVVRTVVQL
jgi:hypothetical protein